MLLWAARALVLIAVLCGVAVTVLHVEKVTYVVQWLLLWVDDLNVLYGSFILAGVTVVGAVLVLPCIPFTLAAGFLYGTLVNV